MISTKNQLMAKAQYKAHNDTHNKTTHCNHLIIVFG